MKNEKKWVLRTGTLQCYVMIENEPLTMYFFGMPEYDRDRPVLSEYRKKKANEILLELNAGNITEKEAFKSLDKIC